MGGTSELDDELFLKEVLMGLDNGFVLKHKEHKEIKCDLSYFRKYYELDGWVRNNCEATYEGSDWFKITAESLDKLKNYIKPVYDVLIKVDEGLISKYDSEGYKSTVKARLVGNAYTNEFNPVNSQSEFAGWKLVHLYQSILSMIEILDAQKLKDDEEDKNWSIEFYSSY